MNYNFVDMNKVGRVFQESNNQLIFDGVNLDAHLTDVNCNFMTLNITGRGVVDYDLNVVTPDLMDGEMLQGITLKSRVLQVEILISAKDNDTLRRKYEVLNKILRKSTVVPIQFTDEPNRVFYGVCVSSDNPKEDSNEQVFNIELYCPKPFKYTPERTINYSNTSILNLESDFPTKPAIEIGYTGASTTLDIMNTTTNKNIKLTGLNPGGERIYKVDVENDSISKSSLNNDGFVNLVLTSDWEDFTISNGDQLVFTPVPESIIIKYRGVYL